MTNPSENHEPDEADRLTKAAFWITMIGVVAYTGSIIAFIL